MARKQQKRHASFGILFWIAFILLIASIFLYNRETIARVLEETQLVDVLRDRIGLGDSDGEEEGPGLEEDEAPDADDGDGARDGDGADDQGADSQESEDPGAGEQGDGSAPPRVVEVPDSPENTPPERPDEPTPPRAEDSSDSSDDGDDDGASPDPGPPEVSRVRSAGVFFIRVTDDGKIHPHRVERRISYENSPMTRTLETLIAGPTVEELNMGLLNLIPKGTELLSARVENGTAYLNFNESFRFNPMGVEGSLGQLQQIVFSSTEFETVEQVQILIDGQERQYLGGEGVYIGEPLSRESFG